jgi:single stranded DNA-binding protein
VNLSLPLEYGQRDEQTRKRPVMWVDAAYWGKGAEAVKDYLKKGQWVAVVMTDIHVEEYQSQGQNRSKVVARIIDLKLVGSAPNSQQDGGSQQHSAPAQQSYGSAAQSYGRSQGQSAPAQPAASANQGRPADFDSFDDDIPF